VGRKLDMLRPFILPITPLAYNNNNNNNISILYPNI